MEGADRKRLAADGFAPPDFDRLNRYGWTWCADESADQNYMDLALLVARNSTCKDGHMGCVLVSGLARGRGGESSAHQVGEVELCTINSALFGAYRSDCHAEANAVSVCAQRGRSVAGMSCFVTRAPCTACYKLLAAAGIGRIVSPQLLPSADCTASSRALGIEVRCVVDSAERQARRAALTAQHEDMDRVRELREERKRLKREKAFGKKSIQADAAAGGAPAAAGAELGLRPDPSAGESAASESAGGGS